MTVPRNNSATMTQTTMTWSRMSLRCALPSHPFGFSLLFMALLPDKVTRLGHHGAQPIRSAGREVLVRGRDPSVPKAISGLRFCKLYLLKREGVSSHSPGLSSCCLLLAAATPVQTLARYWLVTDLSTHSILLLIERLLFGRGNVAVVEF